MVTHHDSSQSGISTHTRDPLPASQVAMYKPMPLEERAAALADIDGILHNLEVLCGSPWLCGPNPTTADAAAMPLFVFITFMLPRFFGWDVFAGRPKLAAWWAAIRQDPHAQRVCPARLTAYALNLPPPRPPIIELPAPQSRRALRHTYAGTDNWFQSE